MSSRALRRLREEKEAALVEDDGEEEESSDEEDDAGGGGKNKAFLMMLEEESSEDESSSSSESEDDDDDDDEEEKSSKSNNNNHHGNHKQSTATTTTKKNHKKNSQPKEEEEEEEDLDAILSDLKIQSHDNNNNAGGATGEDDANASSDSDALPAIRSLLLSKSKGFDVQDLDLDYAMRSLLGGAGAPAGAGGGMDDVLGMDGQPQPHNQRGRQRGGGRGQNNQRGRRTLAKKYLFGKPKNEWGKPPSYVGGGLGVKELTAAVLEEERHTWSVPWPYNLDIATAADGDADAEDDDNDDEDDNTTIPTIPSSQQRWFTLTMADTYQEQNYLYQQLLNNNAQPQSRQQANLHDPNALAMFVADHPYFAETLLQLAMVLYYINDRGRGGDLLRRCMFLYECALPSNVLPNGNADNNNDGDISKSGEILMDIDRTPNSGLFATLFRIMQTSGMAGCHGNALATGRYLLSLDPLRDPMGVLLILDYYALASRRRMSSSLVLSGGGGGGGGSHNREIEAGAAFIVDLVESGSVKIHYKDPLTDRHHWCRLVDMPNWSYSYALALYRLAINEDENDAEEEDYDDDTNSQEGGGQQRYEERAEVALIQSLTRFPMVLPKLLDMNKVNVQDRSFRVDWPKVLPHFLGDAAAEDSGIVNDTVEDRVTRASGEHLVRIFLQRCHKLWKGDDVVSWLYRCSEEVVRRHLRKLTNEEGEEEEAAADGEKGGRNEPPSASVEGQDAVPTTSTTTNNNTNNDTKPIPSSPLLTSAFSPALARYAQCDPSEYEDAFRTFPPEAIALNPNIVAPAMALGPNGGRRRFLRRGMPPQQPQHRHGDGLEQQQQQQDPLEILRQMMGMGGQDGEVEVLDPDSPLLQLYLQSLLPWAQVEGVRPPRR